MSKQSVLKRWLPVLALALLPLLHSLLVQAAPPPPAAALGFTATPTFTPTTPVTTVTPPVLCDPILHKRVDPSMAEQGDLVTFTITAKNRGQQATVNGQVWDIVPDYLEILEVEVVGQHKGLKVHETSGQTVRVDTGILGQGAEVTILIRTRFRPLDTLPTEAGPADPARTGKEVPAPALLCVENVAHFSADNCPDRRAEAAPCLLPTAGTPGTQWGLVAGLATCVLVLSLALSKRWRIETPRQP